MSENLHILTWLPTWANFTEFCCSKSFKTCKECVYCKVKRVKWSHYRPGVAQRVGRGIALLYHDHGTRRGCVVSSTPQPHFTPGKDPVSTLQEAGWAPGPVLMGRKSHPHWDSIPDHPAHSQSLYQLSYPAHVYCEVPVFNFLFKGFRACSQYCTLL